MHVPISLKGLDPGLRPEVIEEARSRVWTEDFGRWGIDISRAFNPIPIVLNSESVLMDNSEVGSRLLESIVLSRDYHPLQHCKDSTEKFARKFCQSFAAVCL